jgi:hypothetical protein
MLLLPRHQLACLHRDASLPSMQKVRLGRPCWHQQLLPCILLQMHLSVCDAVAAAAVDAAEAGCQAQQFPLSALLLIWTPAAGIS